jgi:hypothetical protein
MENEKGEKQLIPRTHLVSGSLAMSPGGQMYYVSPFDGNGVDSVTLLPFLNQDFHDLGGLYAMLDWSNPLVIPIEAFSDEYRVLLNEEGTCYPN